MSNQDFIDSSAIIMPGAYIGLDVIIEDKVTIGPNAVILGKDDNNATTAAAAIRASAVIGANATVLAGVIVGIRALVKPGSVVTRSVPPLAIVEGNPAIITGYVSTAMSIAENQGKDKKESTKYSKVNNVTLSNLTLVSDLRGNLSVGEFEKNIPFKPNRYFLVFDVPTAETRGEHAHKVCKQFLVCIKGSCNVVADDGVNREEFVLDSPAKGLYLPPMIWGIQYHYSHDACLLVFASEYYDSADYIRDYDQFIAAVEKQTDATN